MAQEIHFVQAPSRSVDPDELLIVRRRDEHDRAIGCDAERGTTRRVVIELARLAALEVHVFGEHRAPLGDLVVEAAPSVDPGGRAAPFSARTDARGIARLDGVPSGTVTVKVSDKAERIELVPGERKVVEFSLEPENSARR